MNLEFNILPPFLPLYNGELKDYREIIYMSGRGLGKTKSLIQYCFFEAFVKQKNVLCLREYFHSQKNSLIAEFRELFADLSIKYGFQVSKYCEILYNEIKFKKGGKIIFDGVSDKTVFSLKSISNVDLVFYDEAQKLTKYAYDVLMPTIRKENSQVIFSFNPLNKYDFLYVKAINALHYPDDYTYVFKGTWRDNPLFPAVMERDRLNSLKNDTQEIYKWIWEGEILANYSTLINIDKLGYFDNTIEYRYSKIFITMDTAYTKTNHSDYSVISLFGIYKDSLHILRIMRGQWEFGELSQNLTYMYNFAIEKYKKQVAPIIIEEKSSGISLIQELKKLTHFNIKSVKPTTDKFTRLSKVLYLFEKLRIPLHRSELDSWVDIMLQEMKSFQADLKHEHDDIVDTIIYALDYFNSLNSQISYKNLVKSLGI